MSNIHELENKDFFQIAAQNQTYSSLSLMMLKSEYALCKCQISKIESKIKDDVKNEISSQK